MKYIFRLIHLLFGGAFWLLCMIISFIWHLKWDIDNYPFPFGHICPFVDGHTWYENGKIKLNYIPLLECLLNGYYK